MIGKNLNKLREDKKLGVNELSRLADVNASYISAIENGSKNNPSPKILNKLADALEVDIREFYRDDKLEELSTHNSSSKDELRFMESLNSPEEALKFILSQPSFMAYGGYDLSKMTEEELMGLANDMLFAMRLSLEKRKKK